MQCQVSAKKTICIDFIIKFKLYFVSYETCPMSIDVFNEKSLFNKKEIIEYT